MRTLYVSAEVVNAEAAPQCLELVQMIETIPPAFPNVLNTCGRITVHSTGRYVTRCDQV